MNLIKAFVIIMSDSNAIKGHNRDEDQNLQNVLRNYNAVLEPVKLNDYHVLAKT